MWDQIKDFGTGVASGVMNNTIGTDFGLGGGPTVVGASAVKRSPNQTSPVGGKPAANPNGMAPYMTPSSQGPAISGPANEAIKRKKRKAPGQTVGEFEKEVFEQSPDAKAAANMRGILDMPIDKDTPGLKEVSAELENEIESLEPVQQMEKNAINAGADLETPDEFDLQDFGRLLSSVSGGRQGRAPMHQVSSSRGGGPGYKSKGLWDQRITKEWMDIYNKPLYTPLHKVAAAMR